MEAPKFPSLFRNVKKAPRQFRYKPKHYSARSEQLAERKRAIEEQVQKEKASGSAPNTKREFKPSWSGERYRAGASAANLRLVIIVILLLFITYMVVQWLEKLD